MKLTGWITTKLMKKKENRKSNKQLALKVIENANKTAINAFYINEWMIIHQGNDCY
jgi:hypothetical protein